MRVSAAVLLVASVAACRAPDTANEPGASSTSPAERPSSVDRAVRLVEHVALNRHVRLLDGQWLGTCVASDGNVYFAAGSHTREVGSPFFRYAPRTREVRMLIDDVTAVCGEPRGTQGKIHSDIVEHDGWLYFGTHQSDYTDAGIAAYPGAHLVAYELATGKFRDLGMPRRNCTNYSAVGVDRMRGKIYFWSVPFGKGADGSRLFRIDAATTAAEDLGLVAPAVFKDLPAARRRYQNDPRRGPMLDFISDVRGIVMSFFVDGRGDCWFGLRGADVSENTLYVARGATGKVEAHPEAIPPRSLQWEAVALDENRALVSTSDAFWIFDARRFDGSPSAFTFLRRTDGHIHLAFCADRERFYWIEKSRLWSAPLADPARTLDHGVLRDDAGRTDHQIGSLVTDGRGRLYMVGRWKALPEDMRDIGIRRPVGIAGDRFLDLAVFFSAVDVGSDLKPVGGH